MLIYKVILSFILSVCLVPVMIKVAFKFDIVDKPDNKLKLHQKPIPYLGGIVIFLSVLPFFYKDIGFIVPASILTFIGLYDDIKSVSPYIRLVSEFVVVSMAVYFVAGIIQPIQFLLLVITGMALINGVNMVDGMDGVCAGTAIVSLLFFSIISKNYELLIFVFAISGFLVYNFPPAKIFLGDAGSYLLGFVLFYSFSFLSGRSGRGGYFISLMITAFYFTDLVWAIIRRVINSKSPFFGDKEHIYDKIRKKFNLKPLFVALITYFISFIFGIIGLIAWDFQVIGVIITIITFIFVGYFFKLYKYD